MLVKTAGKDTASVVDALIMNARKLPQELYKSLTWDRGKEMADHKRFTLHTQIQVYFCDPHQLGNVGQTKIPTGCSVSIFQKDWTSRRTHRRSGRGCQTVKRAPKEDTQLRNTRATISSVCCLDRLNAQFLADV
jgi:hypothetical protein